MNEDLSLAYQRAEKMLTQFIAALPNLIIAIALFALFWLLATVVRIFVTKLIERTGQSSNVAQVFARIASWALYLFGLMTAITVVFPSLDAASILNALGFTGVAVGFAFKDIFQNLLAGLLILITHPFRVGDQIISGSDEGTVEEIMVRATRIRTYDNREVIIPNSDLYTNRVTVNTAYNKRRVSVNVGMGYEEDIEKTKQIILAALSNDPNILQDPAPQVFARELADFSINLEVRVWSDPARQLESIQTQDQVIAILHKVLTEAGVDLPFPTQNVLLHDQTQK